MAVTSPSFARMALILAFRERRANPNQSPAPTPAPTPAALPVPTAPAAPLPTSSGITSLRLGLGSASSSATPGPSSNAGGGGANGNSAGASPANSGTQKRQKKKSLAATESDGTPGGHYQKKLKKSQMAAAGLQSLDPNDPTLPQDPAEKEQALFERRKIVNIKKKSEKAQTKERKKNPEADLQVSGMGTGPQGGTGNYSWGQQ